MVSVHGLYWLFPLAATVVWSATLLGLLLWWIIDDHHRTYMITEATVVYISDIGAAHRALFIPGCALTFIFYSLTLLTERYLRHLRRIPGALHRKDYWADVVAIVFGIMGGLALMLLSILNAFEYETAHWSLTAIFVVCIAISAVAQTLQTMWLERDHDGRKHLRRNNIWKLVIVSFAIAVAIAFAVTYGVCKNKTAVPNTAPVGKCNVVHSVGAGCEWLVAFIFDAYVFTFVLDLWPATKTRGHHFDRSLIAADRDNMLHEHKDGRPGAPGLPEPAHVYQNASGDSFHNGEMFPSTVRMTSEEVERRNRGEFVMREV